MSVDVRSSAQDAARPHPRTVVYAAIAGDSEGHRTLVTLSSPGRRPRAMRPVRTADAV